MTGIIYKARNRVNGKLYVGQTIGPLAHRIACHAYGARKRSKTNAFANAIRKYGLQSFSFEIIDEATTQKILDEKEKYWIKRLRSLSPNGYNLTTGGEHVTFTAALKKKMSRNHPRPMLGKKFTLEHRQKIAAGLRGKPKSPRSAEHTRNLGVAQRARFQREPVSEERRAIASHVHTGRKKSPGELENNRKARILVWASWRKEAKKLKITIPQLWELNRSVVQ